MPQAKAVPDAAESVTRLSEACVLTLPTTCLHVSTSCAGHEFMTKMEGVVAHNGINTQRRRVGTRDRALAACDAVEVACEHLRSNTVAIGNHVDEVLGPRHTGRSGALGQSAGKGEEGSLEIHSANVGDCQGAAAAFFRPGRDRTG